MSLYEEKDKDIETLSHINRHTKGVRPHNTTRETTVGMMQLQVKKHEGVPRAVGNS